MSQNEVERITAYRKLKMMGVTTINQAVLLLAANYQNGISFTELSKILGTPRSNVREMALKLKDKKLLTWDYKKNHCGPAMVYITKRGKYAVEQARQA